MPLDEMKAVEDRVIGAIMSGEVKMHSRWYFILQKLFVAFVMAVLILLTIFVVSFIIFSVQASGAWFATNLGVSGWYVFFAALPWSLLFVTFALIVVLAILLNRYSFVYHHPSLYALLGILAAAGLGGSLLAATSFHARVLSYASANGTPVVATFYRFYENRVSSEVRRGEVASVFPGGFVLADFTGQTSTIIFGPNGGLEPPAYSIGDMVVVFGSRDNSGKIMPSGVEKLE